MTSKSIQYPHSTLERAERAMRCSPFTLKLFSTMRYQRVELNQISGRQGVQQGYTRSQLGELAVENDLLWLIQVGILRREVDGQGITDSFRLTPLGRQLVEKYQHSSASLPTQTFSDRLTHTIERWLRLPL
ncbi:MAG: Npun_F0494 family protein [Microcoleaceae cyanobacterium]